MNKITVFDVRKILLDIMSGYDGICEGIVRKSDEELLKTDLRTEFGLDSLDFEDMFDALYYHCGIIVDVHNSLAEYPFHKQQTVENFIETVNYCLSLEK